MSFRGVRKISKNYNKNGVLIYHGEHQSFVFVVRDERNEAQCVQCRWLCKNSNRVVKIYQIQGDTFESDPSVPEHHCCKPMTKDFVESTQLYRETLREVSGTKISPDEAFTKLEENFERFYGSNCFKSIMKKNLSSQKQIKKTFWKRSNKGTRNWRGRK
uniref:Uncharacterized protein n=1 Tax=Panagrolaimus superbus TaxID=310955 RepID=A0A914YZG7_9BILA